MLNFRALVEGQRIIGDRPAAMSAQAHLEAWYTRVGWQRVGDVYDEANIPHVKMIRNAH